MPRVYTLTVEDQLCSWWTCAAGASNLLSFTIIHHHSHGHNLGSVWKCHVLKTNMEWYRLGVGKWGFGSEAGARIWLGARRRPRNETLFLLYHVSGVTAWPFFLVIFEYLDATKRNFSLFFCVLFLFEGVGVGQGDNNVPWHAHTCCHIRCVGWLGWVRGNNVPWDI